LNRRHEDFQSSMIIRSFYLYVSGAQKSSDLCLNVWRVVVICRALEFYLEWIREYRDHPQLPSREQACIAWLLPRLKEVRDTMGWEKNLNVEERFISPLLQPTVEECSPSPVQLRLFQGDDIFTNEEAKRAYYERNQQTLSEIMRRRASNKNIPLADG